MKGKLQEAIKNLTDHDEQLMDQHGEGVLDGFTRELLDIQKFCFLIILYLLFYCYFWEVGFNSIMHSSMVLGEMTPINC